jgi:glycopeptide antibiotics resistance protein
VGPRGWLLVWTFVIAFGVVPWNDVQDHSHWRRVQWIPFLTPPIKPIDLVVNVLLYWPFGYWFAKQARHRSPWRRAILYAAALSLLTEWTQLYSHSRFPSMTDVTCNLIGTLWGASRHLKTQNSELQT